MLLQKTCRSIFFIYFCKKENKKEANTMTKEEMLALEGVSEETLKNLENTKGEDDDES